MKVLQDEVITETNRIKSFEEQKFQDIISEMAKFTSNPSPGSLAELRKVLLYLDDINDWWNYEHGSLLDNAVGNQELIDLLMELGANRLIKSEKLMQFIKNHAESARNHLKAIDAHRLFCLDLGSGIGEFLGLHENGGNYEIADGVLNYITKNWGICQLDKLILNSCHNLTPYGIRDFVTKTNIPCIIVSAKQLKSLTLPEINWDADVLLEKDSLAKESPKMFFPPCYKLPGCDTSIYQLDLDLSFSGSEDEKQLKQLERLLQWYEGNKQLEVVSIDDFSNGTYIKRFLQFVLTLPNIRVVTIRKHFEEEVKFLNDIKNRPRLVYLRFQAGEMAGSATNKLSELCFHEEESYGHYRKRNIRYRFSNRINDLKAISNDSISNILQRCTADIVKRSDSLKSTLPQTTPEVVLQLVHKYEAYMIHRLKYGYDTIAVGNINMENNPLYVRDDRYKQKVEDEEKFSTSDLRGDEWGKFERLLKGRDPDAIFSDETPIVGREAMLKAIDICRSLTRQRLSDALDNSQKAVELFLLYKHPILSRFRQTVEVLLRNCFLSAVLLEQCDQFELRTAIEKVSHEYSFLLNSKSLLVFITAITEGKKYDLLKKIGMLAEKTARLMTLDMQDILVKKHDIFDIYSFARVSVITIMSYIANGSIEPEDTIKETAYNLMLAVIRGPKVKASIIASEGEVAGSEFLRLMREMALEQTKIRESQLRMESKLDEINSKISTQNQLVLKRFDELLMDVDDQFSKLSGQSREQAQEVIRTQKEYFERFVERQFKIDEELRGAIASLTQEVQKDTDFAKDRFGRGRDNITAFKREFYLKFLDRVEKYSKIANGGEIPETSMRKAISTTGSIIAEIPSMGIAGIIAKVGTQVALAVYDMHKRSQYKKKDLFVQRADALSDFSLVIIDLAEAIACIYYDQLQHIVSYDKEPEEIKRVADTAVKLIMLFCVNHEIDKVFDQMKKRQAIIPETVVNVLLSGLIFQGQQVNFVGTQKVATIDELFKDYNLKILGHEIKVKPDQVLDLLHKAYEAGSEKLKEKIDEAAAESALDLIGPVFELLKGIINQDRRHWSIEGMFQRSLFLTFDSIQKLNSLQTWGRSRPHRHFLVEKAGTRCDKYGYCLLPIEVVRQHNSIVRSLKAKLQQTTTLELQVDGLATVKDFHTQRIVRRNEAIARLKTLKPKEPEFTLPALDAFEVHIEQWMLRYSDIYKDKAEIQVQHLTQEIMAGNTVATKEILLVVLLRSLHYSIAHSLHAVSFDSRTMSWSIMFLTQDDYEHSRAELEQVESIKIAHMNKDTDKKDRLRFVANMASNPAMVRNLKSPVPYELIFKVGETDPLATLTLQEFCKFHQSRLIQLKPGVGKSTEFTVTNAELSK